MDIYAEITNRMIAEMELGQIPWRKPWMAAGAAISHTTGKAYSLLNQMLLVNIQWRGLTAQSRR